MKAAQTVVAMVVAVLAAGCGTSVRHPPAVAAPPPPDPDRPPNIVLILTDDQTMESVAKMPYVSSRRDWIGFSSAWINNALCCPSRATILSGRYDTHTGVTNNAQGEHLDERQTLPVWLHQAGYRTGLFGKYLNHYPFHGGNYVPPGWDEWQAAYGNVYPQYNWNLNSNGITSHYGHDPRTDYEVDVLAQKTTDFIAANAALGQPFFAYFAPTATHSPWQASPVWTGRFASAPVRHDPSFDQVDATAAPAWTRALPLQDPLTMDLQRRKEWAGAASVDDAVRRIDAALRTAGVYDHTVEIFMTDNGYSFGDHRWATKRCEYNECSHTPLLVRYPGQTARTDGHLISNVDIASTICQLAGATPGIRQDGTSFAPLLTGKPVGSSRQGLLLHWSGGDGKGHPGRPDSLPQFWGVRTNDWKYVEVDNGDMELYNEVADPYELHNLAGNPAYGPIQAGLKRQLDALKLAADAPAGPLRPDVPSPGPPAVDED